MSTVDVEIIIQRKQHSNARKGGRAPRADAAPRIPRITRLMALAIRFQEMVDRGEVRDYADLARLGYVSRARITQIMNLLMLAPDIQEHLLGLSERSVSAKIFPERSIRSTTSLVSWADQRAAWRDWEPK